MTPTEYRDSLARLRLGHRDQPWTLLGVSRSQHFRYWRSGAPEPVARLLALIEIVGVGWARRYFGRPRVVVERRGGATRGQRQL